MATVIAFTSGKGGVGKTNISTNIALALAGRNEKVCLFDADTGLANINILLGISPRYTIEHVLNGSKSIDEIIIELPSGISIVPAASGIKQCTDLGGKQTSLLISALEKLEQKFDYLLIDTAAGIDTNVLDFVASAQYRVLVITPEPTALTDSFALLKMLLIRGKKKSIFILINKVESYTASQEIFKRFHGAVKTYLKIDVYYLGYLSTDLNVNRAIERQIPVVLSYPNSSISCGIFSLADIIKKQFRNVNNLPSFSQFWANNDQKIKVLANKVNTQPLVVTPETTEPNDNFLADFYSLIEQQEISEQQFKELALTIESIYEKRYKKSLKDINGIVALILAEGDAERIQQLYRAIARSFERQFGTPLTSSMEVIKALANDEKISKNDFTQLMDSIAEIYQKRYDENYFNDGNLLLTKIQHLLADKH